MHIYRRYVKVNELVVGMVVLAIGTSVPDALASIIVARQGQGNMAVSNAIGSNSKTDLAPCAETAAACDTP